MIWLILGTAGRFLLVAPLVFLGILLIPRGYHKRVWAAVPPWVHCWAQLHDYSHEELPDGTRSEYRCDHCKKLYDFAM